MITLTATVDSTGPASHLLAPHLSAHHLPAARLSAHAAGALTSAQRANDPGRELARRAAASLLGINPSMVKIGAHCSHCGGNLGTNHGTPVVVSPAGARVWVSISRVPGLVVASASLAGRVGVDIESITRMSRAPVDAVALHPRELREIAGLRELATLSPAGIDRATTLHWTRKEALLKATGHGLRIPPASIDISGIGGGPVVLRDAPGEVSGLLSTLGARAVFATLRVAELLSGSADAGSADAGRADADIVGTTCVLERP